MLPLPAGREASSGVVAPPYVRHRPEHTLLYQLVEEYYPAFKAHLAAEGTDPPGYVEPEFEDYHPSCKNARLIFTIPRLYDPHWPLVLRGH